jgi:DNA invertase Pin-like site-specific DNA recombinase
MSNGVRIVAGSIYTDGGEDESGAARVGLKSLIEGVEDGSIRTVYVDTLRCLGSPDLVRSLIDRWQRKGVAIVTASHGRVSRHR